MLVGSRAPQLWKRLHSAQHPPDRRRRIYASLQVLVPHLPRSWPHGASHMVEDRECGLQFVGGNATDAMSSRRPRDFDQSKVRRIATMKRCIDNLSYSTTLALQQHP